MSNNPGGKGSAPRPFSVSNEEYAKRWDAIFAKDRVEEETPPSGTLTDGDVAKSALEATFKDRPDYFTTK